MCFLVEVKQALTVFRRAECGFLGVRMVTLKQYAFFCGHFFRSGVRHLCFLVIRLFENTWLTVAISSNQKRWVGRLYINRPLRHLEEPTSIQSRFQKCSTVPIVILKTRSRVHVNTLNTSQSRY